MRSLKKILPICKLARPRCPSLPRVCNRRQALVCLSSGSPEHEEGDRNRWKRAAVLAAAGAALAVFFDAEKFLAHAKQEKSTSAEEAAEGLPEYSAQEVSGHDSMEKRIWVTFRCGVYDVTDFVERHPGGDKILLGAGGSLEPFWNLYGVHKSPEILALLETFRIGNLRESDVGESTKGTGDPYENDPKRHPALKPASTKPFNAEPPVGILADSYVTPRELFYVRNHLPVPEVDPKTYELEIEGVDGRTSVLGLHDLKTKFPKVSVTSVVQCAGNRRSELNKVKKVKGLDWGPCAIGNAVWSGARLVDVLDHFGYDTRDARVQHVCLEGMDLDPTGVPYGSSILADKALDPKGDVLLAYEMNGEELPRDHGYPVRAVVPGVVGARNVKWLARIVLSEQESNSHWQKKDYKAQSTHYCHIVYPYADEEKAGNSDEDGDDCRDDLMFAFSGDAFPVARLCDKLRVSDLALFAGVSRFCFSPSVDWDTVDFDSAPAIQELPVTSAICNPPDGSSVKRGDLHLKGYAWSGGGRKIVRVDVSTDGGQTWKTASLQSRDASLTRAWAWTLWELDVQVPEGAEKLEVLCKAVDSSYNTQPDTTENIWNLRGVLNNAWHRVTYTVVQ